MPQPKETPIVSLKDYTLRVPEENAALEAVNLIIREQEFWHIDTTAPAEARLLLRAVATLERPTSGSYHYKGERLNFTDYRHLLPIKRRIAYIASDATLISNRTLRENLLLGRFYHENSLEIRLDERIRVLIDSFDLADKLEIRAALLSQLDRRVAICIREIAKEPELLLLYRPEEMIDHQRLQPFIEHLADASSDAPAGLVLSYDPAFIERFTNRRLRLNQGQLTVAALQP
jgi:ABC-type ATPase involved in cell division